MKKRTRPQNENHEATQATKNPELQQSAKHRSVLEQAPDSKITELTADLQRTRADFENFRKQTDLQREQAKLTATHATIIKILPLIDDMNRALSAYPDQLSALTKSFDKTLKSLDLEQINTEPGTDFNPDFHDAISMEEGDGDREVIAETLRPGYLYQGQVLRPAMVRVTHAQ